MKIVCFVLKKKIVFLPSLGLVHFVQSIVWFLEDNGELKFHTVYVKICQEFACRVSSSHWEQFSGLTSDQALRNTSPS